MSDQSVTIWTCTRCGKRETLDYGKQPRDWIRVRTANPPHSVDQLLVGDLCFNCRRTFKDEFMRNRDTRSTLDIVASDG